MPDPEILTLEDIDSALLQKAWEHVSANHGSFGVDGITVESYARQASSGIPELAAQIHRGEYVPLPLRKVSLEKKPGSKTYRTLAIPTVRDRIAQTAVAKLLSRQWEQMFLSSSFAYRPGRGVDMAIEQIVAFRDQGYHWILDADITSYFDSIPHHTLSGLLTRELPSAPFRRLIESWIDTSIWDGHTCHKITRGIPQGSPISPHIANFFLTGLDQTLGVGDARMIRYADDFIVLARSRSAAEYARDAANRWLAAHGLHLHPDKTSITNFEDGFHYLGVTFRGLEVLRPWRSSGLPGRLVFAARPMPQQQLRAYRKRSTVRTHPAHSVRSSPPPLRNVSPELPSDMPFLYITHPGSILRKVGERFLVEADQHVLLDVPAGKVDALLLFGNVQVTAQALTEAIDNAIPVSFHTRYGRFRGKVTGTRTHNVLRRIAQYRLYEDTAAALKIARRIVYRKIENGIAVLERYEARDAATDVSAPVRASMRQQSSGALDAASREELLGHEGAAANSYFDGLMAFNRSPFAWQGRKKHPSPDPLNALLSLGYSLLMQEFLAAIETEDLDPAIGFFHQPDGNRASLALDLMEPFRHPLIDRLVLTAVNRHMFDADDFSEASSSDGVHLHPEPLKRFLSEYERVLLSPIAAVDGAPSARHVIHEHVRHFSASLEDPDSWTPFTFPWTAGSGQEQCSM